MSVSDEISASGGEDPDRIVPFVSDVLLPSFLEGYRSFAARGLHTEGATKQDSARLQSWKAASDAKVQINFYLCVDVSDVRIVDAVGNDVTPPDRPPRVPVLATISMANGSNIGVLEGNEPWAGDSFC